MVYPSGAGPFLRDLVGEYALYARHQADSVSRFADMSASPFPVRSQGCGAAVRHLAETDSTNREARVWAEEGAEDGSVVVADFQRAGRGRFSRSWTSAPGQNLLLTVILRREWPRPARLPLGTALAVRQTVADLTGRDAAIKWPNDVWVDGHKVAGILVERPSPDCFLVGIGLNVNQDSFPEDLATPATSLLLETGRRLDRAEVYMRLMASMDTELARISDQDFQDRFTAHMLGDGEMITLQSGENGTVEGIVKGVDPDGGLILATSTGETVYFAGDVSLRPGASSN